MWVVVERRPPMKRQALWGQRASAAKYTSSGRSKKLRGRRGAGRRIVEEKLFMKRGKKWLNVTARLKRSVK
jgi:hypothetical protein